MDLFQGIMDKDEKISVIGLGYVGIPLLISFAKKTQVIGFDIDNSRIEKYKNGIDVTKEVGDQAIKETTAYFTSDENMLKEAKFHIVAVPTPIKSDNIPDLDCLEKACRILSRNLTKDSIVVFESTVYPGVTEDICVSILERESGLRCGDDFKVGYSPERINPGDKVNKLDTITKVVSAVDSKALDIIAKTYELIIEAGVYRAESIKVAEAAKVMENIQRDVNIALMNELSIIFNTLNIDMKHVLKAAKTKWNFASYAPGLVGGHCIGVDPYYLIYIAEQVGCNPEIISTGRRINNFMSKYVVENTIKRLIEANKDIKGSKVGVFGFSFKENCSDIRNTKVLEIIKLLEQVGITVIVVDPIVDKNEVLSKHNIKLRSKEDIKDMDAIIFAVSHDMFKELRLEDMVKMYSGNTPVLIDIKGIFSKSDAIKLGYLYWRF
ncbi:nucleotide sugar dehydrogenase [Brassicibacter mesophilus]|uniref:nucleotide sugar dehydrogenase n=1 Tax=Brassicibacter mesophilus TaxID=745119 RepID=UPI003D1A9B5D